jgi:hypothetical protein
LILKSFDIIREAVGPSYGKILIKLVLAGSLSLNVKFKLSYKLRYLMVSKLFKIKRFRAPEFVWESNPELQGGWCKTEPRDP